MIRNKKILVTGGAGFIGSNLVELLLKYDNKVTVLDNFATGRRENLTGFADNEKFTLIEGDIRDYDTCLEACGNQDFILHQAALGSVPRSIKDPVTTNDVNVGGFVKMLHAAVECKVGRFVYAVARSHEGVICWQEKSRSVISEISQMLPFVLKKASTFFAATMPREKQTCLKPFILPLLEKAFEETIQTK